MSLNKRKQKTTQGDCSISIPWHLPNVKNRSRAQRTMPTPFMQDRQ